MPVFNIKHITNYEYELPVRNSANQIILYPVKDEYQKLIRHELQISGNPTVETFRDYYGNEVGTFTQVEPHSQLKIISKISVETLPRPLPPDDMFTGEQWETLRELQNDFAFADYLKQEHFEGAAMLAEIAAGLQHGQDSPYFTTIRFCEYVFTRFEYIKGLTTIDTTLDEILRLNAGVCQDFAHILTTMLRLTGIPARYVSGYICPNRNGMRGEGATHAWAEAFIPGYGWLGLDPTNNCIANENHVRLAVGRNFSDCSPVRGVYTGTSGHVLEVNVSVGQDDKEIFETESNQIPKEYSYSQIATSPDPAKNSYQRYLEDMQQQQQQ